MGSLVASIDHEDKGVAYYYSAPLVCGVTSKPFRTKQSLLETNSNNTQSTNSDSLSPSGRSRPGLLDRPSNTPAIDGIVWLQPGQDWDAIVGKPVDYDEDI